MLKESIEAMGRTIEKLTTDSSSQVVVFETHTTEDTSNRNLTTPTNGKIIWNTSATVPATTTGKYNKIEFFPDGRLKSAEGQIKSITTKANRAEAINDSLYTTTLIMQDSINTLKAEKHVEVQTKYVEVHRRSWWWLWLIVGSVIGWTGRGYWPRLRIKLFGK